MSVRENVFKIIVETFQLHGAVTIDTPVFERKVGFLFKTACFMDLVNFFSMFKRKF